MAAGVLPTLWPDDAVPALLLSVRVQSKADDVFQKLWTSTDISVRRFNSSSSSGCNNQFPLTRSCFLTLLPFHTMHHRGRCIGCAATRILWRALGCRARMSCLSPHTRGRPQISAPMNPSLSPQTGFARCADGALVFVWLSVGVGRVEGHTFVVKRFSYQHWLHRSCHHAFLTSLQPVWTSTYVWFGTCEN
jgi:hypothetical protein